MSIGAANIRRLIVGVASVFIISLAVGVASAVSLTVLPVTIQMAPGQRTTALTVINHGHREIAFQVRAFAWTQLNGHNKLAPTAELLASPPLGTLAAGGRQIIRMELRRPPQGREASYRILLDEIPPPAVPGMVRIALRMSIPIFAEPQTRVAPHVLWKVDSSDGQSFLVGVNEGTRHETLRDIKLQVPGGGTLKVESNINPYILAGATMRWHIVTPSPPLAPGAVLQLTASTNTGHIDQSVRVVGSP
ncbi:MAG: fimbria/pilus periplasmic chaperone [Gammaproteobacteria bacterium]|nr:fimbria/pilus periplasmic chaperone [Gammaproteobacteria bacterium]